jgi:hypothetical protein
LYHALVTGATFTAGKGKVKVCNDSNFDLGGSYGSHKYYYCAKRAKMRNENFAWWRKKAELLLLCGVEKTVLADEACPKSKFVSETVYQTNNLAGWLAGLERLRSQDSLTHG